MKVVLAYSGGLDTSVIVKWIKERFNAEVVTFAANVGQGEELSGLAEKAKATGASAHYTVDLQDEFVSDFIYPMIRANAVYEGQYYLGTSIARPLIAKAQIKLRSSMTLFHRFLIPIDSLCMILGNTCTIFITVAQTGLCFCISLLSCFLIPMDSCFIV